MHEYHISYAQSGLGCKCKNPVFIKLFMNLYNMHAYRKQPFFV